jgi:hypothetical protein
MVGRFVNNGLDVKENGRDVIRSTVPEFARRYGKESKNLSQDNRSPGRGLNSGPPDFAAGVQHSTANFGFFNNAFTLRGSFSF